MFLFDKIIPIYFFVALFVGFLMTYAFTPPPEIIYKFPTPDNAKEVIYQDKANHCFKYKSSEITCPKNKKDISKLPY